MSPLNYRAPNSFVAPACLHFPEALNHYSLRRPRSLHWAKRTAVTESADLPIPGICAGGESILLDNLWRGGGKNAHFCFTQALNTLLRRVQVLKKKKKKKRLIPNDYIGLCESQNCH